MKRRGLTLVEVMFALALTTMVGAAAAAMMTSVSQSTRWLDDSRRLAVRQRVIAERLGAATRSSAVVLGFDESAVVLWTSDTQTNGVPNLSEIRRIQWDRRDAQLWFYAPPPDIGEAADTEYGPSDDFLSITERLMDTRNFTGRRWGTGVVRWSPTVEASDTGRTTVSYDLTIDLDGTTRTQIHTFALRNR